jgi:hypothetical protein
MRIILLTTALIACASAADRRITLAELRDKIEGGWAGKMIGVSFGAPTEFRFREQINESELPKWTPERVSNSLDQDDLYVNMTFAQVLDEKGLEAATQDFGNAFKEAKYRIWHANLAARRALKRGVPATLSGTPRYSAHTSDIGFQFESDFIGLMAPGLPRAAGELCDRVGHVMIYGTGIYAGMFVSGMYAAAFFESDPRRVVEAGLACVPPKSGYARAIGDVLAWARQYPDDWKHVWRLIEEKWNQGDACPEGALRPFNIDAKLNGAYVALGLLCGGGDFGTTIEIATRAGQDSDCNPATAAGVLGAMLGYRRIPEQFKSGISAIADKKFNYTGFTFRTIVESTQKRAVELVKRNGGRLEGNTLIVKVQAPRASKIKQEWKGYGAPVERIANTDPRWSWKGAWRPQQQTRVTSEKGAEASVQFEGAGAILVGPYLPTGGKADVYLDGKFHRTVDVYPDEDNAKRGEAVWHAFGLKNGKHLVRLVVRGEPFGESKGAEVGIDDLVVFR